MWRCRRCSCGLDHAIGAGLVIAEIQQRSDTTFRLFDYGRPRALHVEEAVAVADAGFAPAGPLPRALGPGRTLLVTSSHFILEKIDVLPRSKWTVRAPHETWLLLLHGHARVGLLNAFPGEAVFLEDEETTVQAGALGMQALVAYEARRPDMMMLRPVSGSSPHRRSRRSSSRCPFGDVTASVSLAPGGSHVSLPQRIAFVGNALPRRCGIATFTTDLERLSHLWIRTLKPASSR